MLRESSSMFYPVLVNGVVRAQIQVTRTARGWEGVAFGQPGFARLIDRYRTITGSSTLVHVASLNQLFLVRGGGGSLRFTPLHDAPRINLRAGVELPASRAFAALANEANLYEGKMR